MRDCDIRSFNAQLAFLDLAIRENFEITAVFHLLRTPTLDRLTPCLFFTPVNQISGNQSYNFVKPSDSSVVSKFDFNVQRKIAGYELNLAYFVGNINLV